MSRLTRTSLLLAFFFALDKCVAILRQIIIARQFGLSAELDAFNVANNIPDLLFALISGGALAMAFIPVLTEKLTREGRESAWLLFSRIANLAFLITTAMAIIVAFLAEPLVTNPLGVAPGFSIEQQALVVRLMRLNLIATVIFSISGLVIAGLQSNKHFLLPAMAPLLYNIGQIFGAVILAPVEGYSIGSVRLPAFSMGINGLVFGVLIGAGLHLMIQVPGLIHYGFKWNHSFGINDISVRKVLSLLAPRILTMFFIQLVFIARDNMASHLTEGAVTALTYGWMIQQVPETLIGTALGTALLPTLAELVAKEKREEFLATIQRAVRVLIGITIPGAVVLGFGLGPLVQAAFGFSDSGTNLMLWVTRGYLVGLFGHCLLEVSARSFYARQDARTPLIAAGFNLILFVFLGGFAFNNLGPAGISLADSISFSLEALLLLFLLNLHHVTSLVAGKRLIERMQTALFNHPESTSTLVRAVIAAFFCMVVSIGLQQLFSNLFSPLIAGIMVLFISGIAMLPFIWREIRLLFRL